MCVCQRVRERWWRWDRVLNIFLFLNHLSSPLNNPEGFEKAEERQSQAASSVVVLSSEKWVQPFPRGPEISCAA